MTNKTKATLDVSENLNHLEEPLYLASDLVEFFSRRFRRDMSHDYSKPTRRKLWKTRNEVMEDLNKLLNVLNAIDPDLVLEWQLGHVSDEDDDLE